LGRTQVREEQNGRDYRKISINPYFAHNFFFPKWLQANLAYNVHPWFVPRSQLVYKIKENIFSIIS
jgi:hypothetical protein